MEEGKKKKKRIKRKRRRRSNNGPNGSMRMASLGNTICLEVSRCCGESVNRGN